MQPLTPFIINLDIHPQGYTFASLHYPPPAPPKPKKTKTPPSKSRIANRLIKEIGLNPEIPPVIPEENPYSRDIYHHTEEVSRIDVDLQEEEELDCEVHRETALPKSPAQWFDITQIHQKETEHFPEYFTGRGYKTPELFQAYRNFMVEAYLRNPKRYLSFIPCRKVMKGDVNSLLKIYRFLSSEGIINYCLGAEGNYDFKTMDIAQVSEMGKKHQSCLKKVPEKSQQEETSELDTDNLTVSVINKNFSRSYRVYCDSCKLICGIAWYALSEDDQSKNLCIDCYNSMPAEEVSGYVKMDITKKIEMSKERGSSKSSWGLEDNIKLLDFMGASKNKNWTDIEGQFETKKSLEDIILQFMQFPITNFDPYHHQHHLSHPKPAYRQEQYIKLLDDLYKESPYAVKQEQQEDESAFKPSAPLPSFKAMNSLFLERVNSKIEQLQAIETIWEETNLSIREQSLVTRVKYVQGGLKGEESSSVKNEED